MSEEANEEVITVEVDDNGEAAVFHEDGSDNPSQSTSGSTPPPRKTRKRTSPVWSHFEETEKPRFVKCKHCSQKVRGKLCMSKLMQALHADE